MRDKDYVRDALKYFADSVPLNKMYHGTDGAIVKHVCDADYIASHFTDEYIVEEMIKRLPQYQIVNIFEQAYAHNQ
jgi:hypothetical protein